MKRAYFLAVVAAALALAKCSDSTGLSRDTTIDGTYELRTVNSKNLPFVLMTIGTLGTTYRLEMVSATLTITGSGDAGTYSDHAILQETNGGRVTTQTEASAGTWTRTNNALVLRDTIDGSIINGSLSSGIVRFTDFGISFEFRK